MTATYEIAEPHTRKYLRYMIAFGVSVAIGLSPLLGNVNIPGFTAILTLFPLSLRSTVIPFAAFIMALPALAVQFYALDRSKLGTLRRWFKYAIGSALLAAVALFIGFMQVVVAAVPPGTDQTLRYVIGPEMRSKCPCVAKSLEIEQCIGQAITADPVQVEGCYPRSAVQFNKTIISLIYFAMMASFGTAIGVLILREGVKHAQPKV
jgi:hypothetical protein